MPFRAQVRIAAIVLVGVVCVLASYLLMADPHPSPWNAVGVLAPMLVAIVLGAWRADQRALSAIAAIALTALLVPAALGITVSAQRMYLAQHVGIHLFLACGFGSTLGAGRTPLITLLAGRLHRDMPIALRRYTRRLTLTWAAYFVAMALLSLLLYGFASFEAWALFANLLTPIATGLMFGGEYLLRYRLHPEFERISMADAIRSYRMGSPQTRTGSASADQNSADQTSATQMSAQLISAQPTSASRTATGQTAPS